MTAPPAPASAPSGAVGGPVPPRVPGVPRLGGALLLGADPAVFFADCYRRYGPVFDFDIPGRRIRAMAGPEASLFASRSPHLFTSGPDWLPFGRAFGAVRLMTGLDGADHARVRSRARRGYSSRRVAGEVPAALAAVRRRLRAWPPGQPRSLHGVMQRLAGDVVGLATAGQGPGPILGDLTAYVRAVLASTVSGVRPRFLLALPPYRGMRRRLAAFADGVIARHRRAAPAPGGPDLIDDQIAFHDADPAYFPVEDLRLAVLAPYIAGLDTLAAACSFGLLRLRENPAVLASVRAEGRALLASDGGPAALALAPVARAAVMEVLRLHPAAPALPRRAAAPFLFGGYGFPRGARVYVATGAALRDPACFRDPEVFDVGRYAPPRDEHKAPGAYLPFGVKPHACLGSGLATAGAVAVLAACAASGEFDFEPHPSGGFPTVHSPLPRPAPSVIVRYRPF